MTHKWYQGEKKFAPRVYRLDFGLITVCKVAGRPALHLIKRLADLYFRSRVAVQQLRQRRAT